MAPLPDYISYFSNNSLKLVTIVIKAIQYTLMIAFSSNSQLHIFNIFCSFCRTCLYWGLLFKTEKNVQRYGALYALILHCMCSFAELHVAEQLRLVQSEGVGVMHARGQGGSNKDERRRRSKVFSTKRLKIKKARRALTLAPHCTRPICFVPSYLPLPSEGEPLGAILGPSSLPWPLFSPQPLKSCTAMCMALMFALYPTCKAIIIHASWQSQALSLLHLQLFALGYDMTVRLISSLLHIAPCVSLSFCFSALRLCTMFESNSDLTTWNIFYLSACVTPLPLWCVRQLFQTTRTTVGQKCLLMFDTR